MNKTCKRILSVMLTVCLCFGSILGMAKKAEAATTVQQVDYPRGYPITDDNFSKRGENGWGHPALTFMNGWFTNSSKNLGFHSIGGATGLIAYCLEPGTFGGLDSEYRYQLDDLKSGEEYFTSIYNNINQSISGETARSFIETIITNGYHDHLSDRWNSGNASDAQKMGQAYATSLLVWEVIVGERNDQFDHINPPAGTNKVLDHISNGNPIKNQTIAAYNALVKKVKDSVAIPSFCSASAEQLTATEMKADYANKTFKITFTDNNGVSSLFEYSSDNPSINIKKDGNTLIVTAPFTIAQQELVITGTHSYTTGKINVYTDGEYKPDEDRSKQDIATYIEGSSQTKVKTAYFSIKIPHAHFFVPYMTPPTCTMEGRTVWICRCGVKMTTNPATGLDETRPATGHDYENSPWVIQKPATCTEAGEEVMLCHKCGEPILTRVIDPVAHNGVWKVDSEPTADHDGVMAKICTICGRTLETKTFPLHTHTEGSRTVLIPATCGAPGEEGLICADCGACYDTERIEPLGHTPGADCIHVTATAATCTADGEQTLICTRCGETVGTEPIPAAGHDDGVWLIDDEATPEHDGQKTRYCTKCGEALETETFAAHTHTEGHRIVTQAATCTQAGEERIFCADCGAGYDTAVLPALGHTAEEDCIRVTAQAATCTADGRTDLLCARCGEFVASEAIPALGHDDGVWTTAAAADCTHAGTQTHVCTRCGETIETREIPALGHSATPFRVTRAATCEAAGEEVSTCERCGAVIEKREILALGHDDGVWKVIQEATSEHDGLMVRSCSRCGQQLESKTFAAHTHSFGHESVVRPATCEEEGLLGWFCFSCGAMYGSEPIPALGHSYTDWSTNQNGTHSRTCSTCHDTQTENCVYAAEVTPATCTAHGFTTYTCTICGDVKTGDITPPLGHALGAWTADANGVTHSAACTREGCDYHETQRHGDVETVEQEEGLFSQAIIRHTCPDCGFTRTVTLPRSPFMMRLFRFFGVLFRRIMLPFRNL